MITAKDLIEDMEGVPLGVARLMSIRQWDAVGKIDPEIFQGCRAACDTDDGFLWSETPEWQISTSWWAATIRDGDRGYILRTYRADISVFPDNKILKGCE